MSYVLHIADKAYSSWSLRGWLLLQAFGLPFEERLHRLYEPGLDDFRAATPPARSVPTLCWDAGRAIAWDSLAIAETLAERHPGAGHWPAEPAARAAARSLAAEMHAGFAALRAAAPMNTRRGGRPLRAAPPAAVAGDLERLSALWAWTRARWGGGGPMLFGTAFTAADAFFAPVAFRIAGYDLAVASPARAYVEALLAHDAVRRWAEEASADPRMIDRYEQI